MTEAEEKDSIIASRLGMCSVCAHTAAKYTCPRCGVKTCSLTCVKSHKKDAGGCSGVRDKTVMVLKDEMDNLTLLSDYRFLEEIDHKLEDNQRHPLRRYIAPRPTKGKPDLPFFLSNLRNEAAKRGTTLKFVPNHFSKHKENTTRYIAKEGIIRWHIKWVFHQADITFTKTQVDENTPIITLLARYMEPNDGLSPEEAEKLAYYHSASYSRIAVLLQAEREGSKTAFCEVVLSKSLRQNLANCKVVEYPTLYVILRDHMQAYLEYEADGHDDLFEDGEAKEEKEEEQQEKKKEEGLFFFEAN
ncbi:box C/D snoRNA protein 1-like [Penaeus japonicus]|uniref:box C/D snoRNA protein 1-like n=1 Tax=Penaeus japonicus TaxID=27405 RepID=UPI001C712C33|nr:box C/D snoRNA protein 1-like [Penaeus japonicus]